MNKITVVLVITMLFLSKHSTADAQTVGNTNYDSLRTVLEKMYDEDQEIRRILTDSIRFDSPEAGPYIGQLANIDMRNRSKIESILKKYGWIEKSKIGEKASEAIFYTVQHTDLEFVEKYFPQFKAVTDRGEANPRQCATMQDRILMWKDKKQIHGTQTSSTLRPDKKMAIWPIENPAGVNELRKRTGFNTTVEEYAKQIKAEYNPKEKLPTAKN